MRQSKRVPERSGMAWQGMGRAWSADGGVQTCLQLSRARNSAIMVCHTLGDPFLGESSMAVSRLEGLLSADDLADEQAAVSRGYREEPFSHACASRIFSSIEKRCRFSSRGTCTEETAFYWCPMNPALTGAARTE